MTVTLLVQYFTYLLSFSSSQILDARYAILMMVNYTGLERLQSYNKASKNSGSGYLEVAWIEHDAHGVIIYRHCFSGLLSKLNQK